MSNLYTRTATGEITLDGKVLKTEEVLKKLNKENVLDTVFLRDPDTGEPTKLLGISLINGGTVITTEGNNSKFSFTIIAEELPLESEEESSV